MISELTSKVLAYPFSPDPGAMDEVVDWAVEMMELGYESVNLYILAGLSKPVLYYDAAEYLGATFKDLNLKILNEKDAIDSLGAYYILKIARGEDIRTGLHSLKDLSLRGDGDNNLDDFYLLYFQWWDLDDDIYPGHYFSGATKENIEQLTINTAKKWLDEHEDIWKNVFKSS